MPVLPFSSDAEVVEFAKAFLYRHVVCFSNPDTGKPLKSCTMIITDPNKVAAKIHDRMPVLLSPDQFEPWLSGKGQAEMLNHAADGMIVMRPVSKRVNRSRADDSDPIDGGHMISPMTLGNMCANSSCAITHAPKSSSPRDDAWTSVA